jgi:hypothetical protein
VDDDLLRCMGIYSCGGSCMDAIFQGFRVGFAGLSMCDEIRSGENSVIWMALVLTTTIKKPLASFSEMRFLEKLF